MSALYRSVLFVGRFVPEVVKKPLRGDYNSVSKRFLEKPIFMSEILIQKLRGRRYLDWYADRLNSNRLAPEELAREASMQTGDEDLEALKAAGLRPSHSFYEFGLGYGRSAQHFIDYLDSGRYVGNDITRERVRMAERLFAYKGLDEKKPELFVSEDNSFDWVKGRTFDYIWSGAVFGHVPDRDVVEILTNIKKIMHAGSQFFLADTHFVGRDDVYRYTSKDWFRPVRWYCETGNACGLDATDASHYLVPGKGSHFAGVPLGPAGKLLTKTHLIRYTLPRTT